MADAERQRGAVELQGANERLRGREADLKEAQRVANVGNWKWVAQTDAFNCSEEFCRIFGRDPEGPTPHYKDGPQLFTPESCASLEPAIQRTLRTGMPYDLDLEIVRPDGTRIWITVRGEAVRDEEGLVTGLQGTAQDITERLAAEERLRQSEERFRTMANSIPQLAWIAQVDGYIFWYNQRWYEYTGTTPEEMEGWGWQCVHDPLVLPSVLDRWKASIATGEPFELVFPLRRADGLFRRFLTRVLPLKDAEGHVLEWFGTNTDINEQECAKEATLRLNGNLKRQVIERTVQLQTTDAKLDTEIADRRCAEEFLRQSEERFRLLVDSVQDYAIFMLSPDGHIASWNKGAERIKGYKAEEVIGKHFSCFYPPEDIAKGTPAKELLTATEQGHIENEGWRVRKDGRQFWANVVITGLFDNNGCLQGFAKVTRDMTERKLHEEILQNKNSELQKAVETKDNFLANMSHELRTPLNGIIGFAEFLADGKPGGVNPKQKEYLEDILNSGKHLLQLVSDILDLAKVGVGKMKFNPERFLLHESVEEACAVTRPIAQKKTILIEANVAPEIGDVTLDQQKFKQVLYNLLSTAIRFSHDGGKVEIRAAMHDAQRFKLAVLDNGIGIKEEDLQRIFKEFEQVETGASRCYEGTGLGLALTRKIVELQGGTIGVESEYGKGSTFTVVRPLVAAGVNV